MSTLIPWTCGVRLSWMFLDTTDIMYIKCSITFGLPILPYHLLTSLIHLAVAL